MVVAHQSSSIRKKSAWKKLVFGLVALVVFGALLVPLPTQARAQAQAEGDGGGAVDYIVGGTDAEIADFPFMVQLWRGDGGHECSGTLLREDRVMTAAHCIRFHNGTERDNLDQWVVAYGSASPSTSTTVGFSGYSVIRGTNAQRRNDLAILHLDQPIPLSANVQLVTVATDAEIEAATGGLVLGWGKTSDADPSAAVLQQTNITWLSDADCVSHYGDAYFPLRHFCGGDATTDICHGDSGGPTLISDGADGWKQVAITTAVYGHANCATGVPSLFTDLRTFRDRLITPHSPSTTAKCRGQAVTVFVALGHEATEGDDVILGTNGDDVINGLGGNDIICGARGDDVIDAGDGDDVVDAAGGDDRVIAGLGADTVFAGPGDDYVDGGPGNDKLWGGTGNDELRGHDGDDVMLGKSGDDSLFGGFGNDSLYGMAGVDRLFGDEGDDLLGGGLLGDTLDGGPGNDELHGKLGPDVMRGSDGDDKLYGGGGADNLDGGDGDDLLRGGHWHDHLVGGAGVDECRGMAGTDTADASCDTIFGVP